MIVTKPKFGSDAHLIADAPSHQAIGFPDAFLSSTSSRRLRQHHFRNEDDLVEALTVEWMTLFDAVESFPSYPVTPMLRTEWPIGRRIADLMAFSMEMNWEDSILSELQRLSKTTPMELAVLAHFVDHPSSPDLLRESVFMGVGELERIVDALVRKQILTTGHEGLLKPNSWCRFLPKSIHLVEAKIEDWREAIGQAIYYRGFADSVSVALPISFERHLSLLEACNGSGVGLLLVPPDGIPVVAVKARQIPCAEASRKAHLSLQILKRLVVDFLHAHSVRSTTINRRACSSM